jgi:hypothetical protein
MHFIEYKRGLYACSEPQDGSAGKIYLNGDRGIFGGGTQASLTYKEDESEVGAGTATLTPQNRWYSYSTGSKWTYAAFKLVSGQSLSSGQLKVTVFCESGSGPVLKLMASDNNDPDLTGDTSGPGSISAGETLTASGTAAATWAQTGYFALSTGWAAHNGVFRITKIVWDDGSENTLWDETAAVFEDTAKSWTTNEWTGAYCHIWNGTAQGQYRKIASNTATELTVTPPWDEQPAAGGSDIGSEYVIIGTNKWQDVTPNPYDNSGTNTGITSPITDVLSLWGILYLAQGEKDNILRVREYNNAGTWTDFWGSNSAAAVSVYDGTNKALFLGKTYDPVNENYVWRARNENPAEWTGTDQTSVSKADDVNWGTSLTFGNPIPVGSRDYLITGLTIYNGKLWIGKENSIWYIDFDGTYDRAYPLQIGLEAMSDPDNCKAMIAKDLFLFFNWANSVERMYGSTLDDVGPWRGAGLPDRARGPIVSLVPVIGWMFATVDGYDSEQSSVLLYNERGWHTLFRAPPIVTSAFAGRVFQVTMRLISSGLSLAGILCLCAFHALHSIRHKIAI